MFHLPRSYSICVQVIFLAGIFAVTGCGQKSGTAEKNGKKGPGGVAPVVVGKVQRKVAPLILDAVGVVEAIHTAALRSQVTGTILKVGFREGQDIDQGGLLFELDPRPFQNALNSAEADLERIRAQLENARLQVARYSSLNLESMVTKEQFQQIQVAERVLDAQVVVGENAVSTARLQLDYCSIRAPFTGRTGGLGAHEGDLVRASDAAVSLVTINQLGPIYVTFGVPQQHLALLSHYQAAGTIAVSATPPGAEQTTETGELSFLDNAVDAGTGTLKLKATFANTSHRLWPGQFVGVRMTLASPQMLVVPSAAVQNGQKGQHVFVVNKDNVAELRPITVARTVDSDSVISAGLEEGETVVVDGQFRVTSGKQVEIKNAGESTAALAPKKKKKAP